MNFEDYDDVMKIINDNCPRSLVDMGIDRELERIKVLELGLIAAQLHAILEILQSNTDQGGRLYFTVHVR